MTIDMMRVLATLPDNSSTATNSCSFQHTPPQSEGDASEKPSGENYVKILSFGYRLSYKNFNQPQVDSLGQHN